MRVLYTLMSVICGHLWRHGRVNLCVTPSAALAIASARTAPTDGSCGRAVRGGHPPLCRLAFERVRDVALELSLEPLGIERAFWPRVPFFCEKNFFRPIPCTVHTEDMYEQKGTTAK